jgi:hypothetical protein
MHLTSKIRRCLNNIETFINKPYPKDRALSYTTTHASLRQYQSILNGHLNREPRKEGKRGSHYMSCFDDTGNCRCVQDNQNALMDIEMANRLMRGM